MLIWGLIACSEIAKHLCIATLERHLWLVCELLPVAALNGNSLLRLWSAQIPGSLS